MYSGFFKVILDYIITVLLVILSSPIILFVMIFLFFVNKGKIFFLQPRPGKDKKVFNIIKFRTMTEEKDNRGNLLSDENRLTNIGKILRKMSFDELPQLFNVLLGDMSLIGPRPLLIEYLDLYDNNQIRRQEVKPGITGWAQVNGRNAISWEKRFEYDIYYVDNISFIFDIKILFLTICKILKGEGVSGEGSVTMERFLGNENE